VSVPRIVRLAQVPEHIGELARAHVDAFGALLPDWTLEVAEQELRSHTDDVAIPATWVALDEAGWCGSVSLLHDDHPLIRDYSPWLASLYVRADARGQGIGEALVAHCIAAARQLGVGRVFLYCEPPLVAYYEQRGWTVEVWVELPLVPKLAVMVIDTAPDA
jgi:GNAT superfamily N-acetyltransferase